MEIDSSGLMNSSLETTETAKSADSFVDAIGVNTHLTYTDTVYNQFDDIIKPKLTELGVRHVRDGAYIYSGVNRDSLYYQRLRELGNAGIKFDLVTGAGDANYYSLLDDVYSWSDGAVESFEGINEPDLSGTDNWVTVTRNAQQQLYETVKGNATLNNVSVLGPSIAFEHNAIGDISGWTDNGNVHAYYGGRLPESTGWGDNGYGSVAWQINYAARPVSGSDPVMATETGWHNALETTSVHNGMPEDVVATYLPRLLLNNFNGGIARSYVYEFIDEWNDPNNLEANFGLLRNDGSPKPAYTALKNLIDVLEDPGYSFTPGSLAFGLDGDTTNLQHTLLQKSNGDFYLALWAGEYVWDSNTKTEIDVPDRPVTLTLPDSIAGATLYAFNEDGTMASSAATIANNELDLAVKDTVTIVQLTPDNDSGSAPVPDVDQAPVAAPDIASTPTNTPVKIEVLANDTTGDNFTLTLVNNPTQGSVQLNDNGTPQQPTDDFVLYTPNSSVTGTDQFTYQLDTGNGGSTTATVSVSITPTEVTPPVPEMQDLSKLIDLRNIDLNGDGQVDTKVSVTFSDINSDAGYDDSVGLYVLANEAGAVLDSVSGKLIQPGETGYAQAAVQQRLSGVNMNRHTGTLATQLEAGGILAPYLIADGTPEQFLAQNGSNQEGLGPNAYFTYMGANPDKADHMQLLGNNQFGFEDMWGGGDGDFNDFVFRVNLQHA